MYVCPDVVSVARHLVLTALLLKTEDAPGTHSYIVWRRRWRHYSISKRRNLLTQRHIAALYKSSVISVPTKNLQILKKILNSKMHTIPPPPRNGSRVILCGRADKTRLIVKNYMGRGRNIEAVLSTFHLHHCFIYRINSFVYNGYGLWSARHELKLRM